MSRHRVPVAPELRGKRPIRWLGGQLKVDRMHMVTFILLSLAVSGDALAQRSSLQAQLVQLEERRQAAYVAGNRAELERQFADEYVHTNLRGGRTDRQAELAFYQPGRFSLQAGRVEDVIVHRHQNTATLTGTVIWEGAEYRPNAAAVVDLSGRFSVSRVYVWRGGRWQLALSHASRIPDASNRPFAHTDTVSLDVLAGRWMLFDAAGAQVGESVIDIQTPGAMLHERRRIGDGQAQSLWFANLEHTGGWTQLFASPNGIREFSTLSAPAVWPLVLGARVRLQDGGEAAFRLTITRTGPDRHRRVLTISRDGGANWNTVLDLDYRRVGAG